jgi:hypothetical protein
VTPAPDLTASIEDLYRYGMAGDVRDASRSNFQEAMAILQFQVLVEQRKTAVAQRWAAIATVLLFLATLGLIAVTA